ncbi:MAG: hypothetical protein ACFFBP_06255 [Promethearchaeota archaeon]
MSKKVAAAAIILIAFGGVSIPGGIVINNYIKDLTYSSIDEGLLGIRTEGIPMVEHMVNCTFFATFLNLLYNNDDNNLNSIFNDSLFEITALGIHVRSIANYTGLGDLNYSYLACKRLLLGNETPSLGYIPGLIEDIDTGEGIINFLEDYNEAQINTIKRNEMIDDYKCNWDHLTYLVDYYNSFFVPETIPQLLPLVSSLKPELAGLNNTLEIAEYYLYAQWAWGNLKPEGFPLPLGDIEVYGFEVGYQGPGINVTSTNMTREAMYLLWNTSNPLSLVIKTGVNAWLGAVNGDAVLQSLLLTENNLTSESLAMILEWIPKFQQNVMPFLAQYQMGLPTDSITLGNIIQVAAIGLGGVCIGLGGVAITGNVVAKRKKLAKKQIGTLDKSKSVEKGDSEQKYI